MIGPLAPPVPHMESGAHLGVRCNHSFSHWEVTEGITVEGEESVDTKKYAVDGIPWYYKRACSMREKSVSPSPIPYFSCPQHVPLCSAPM